MNRRNTLAALSALAWPFGAGAQTTFPSKPLTIIVPATPGGAIDLAARLIGAKLSVAWSQPVAIDNVGGAAGMLGSDRVAKAAPDGHVLALVASSHAINPSMYKKLPFDTLKAFEPVMQTHAVPLVKGYETSTWGGLLAPAGTPKDVVAKLNAEANKALAAPDVRDKLIAAGIEPVGGTAAQFNSFIQSEMTRWTKVAQAAGVQPE